MEAAAAFTLLLVQDHLKFHGLFDTLATFSKELTAKAVSVSPDVWYEMAHGIGIHGLMHDYPHESTLTALVHVAVVERQSRLRATAPSIVHVTPKASRHRPPTSTGAGTSTPLQMSASSPSLRPKSASAAVVATCASAPTLKTALTSPSRAVIPATDRPSSCSSNNQHDEQTKAHRGDGRLLKSSKAQQRETPARLPQLKAIEAAMRDFAQPSNRKPLNNAMASAPSPVESSSSSMIVEPAAARQWISDDVRLRQVRRGFAHVQQEVQVHHKTEMVLKHQGVGKAIPPRPNERVVIACSLCLHPFQKHNLAHQVPYKAVMDLRRSWDPHMKELHPTRARPPTCYDLVRICAFCAQFVQESERYRPVGGVSATDVQASQTSATNRCMTTVEENGMNDPFACDPILDGDDDADSETAMLLASRCSIGGVIGRNIRYQLQNTHTVRNLSEAEWDVISIAKHQHVAEFNGEMVPTVNDIRRSPMSMKRLLMDATKLAPLTESSNHSDRPSPTATDRRQSTEEPAAHCNVYR